MLVANFKSHKTTQEVMVWIDIIERHITSDPHHKVVMCPPFPALSKAHEALLQMTPHASLQLGAQDVSSFGEGAYTGEVSATALAGLVTFGIVGHSERRKYFHETSKTILDKSYSLLGQGITPIICISEDTLGEVKNFPEGSIIAFEPLTAIGSGKPASKELIKETAEKILQTRAKACTILYGGSVAPDNAAELLIVEVAGFLIGSQSLDPQSFIAIYDAIR